MEKEKTRAPGCAKENAKEAIIRDRDSKIEEVLDRVKKNRIEIVRCMSDAVNDVEKWYSPQIDGLEKKNIFQYRDSSVIKGGIEMFTSEARKKWILLQEEKRRKLDKIEQRYMSDLRTNEAWGVSEVEKIMMEADELLSSLD